MFATLQGRLPKDLRLAGITTVEAANAWLKAHYMAEHNAAFAIKAEQQGTAFVADRHEACRQRTADQPRRASAWQRARSRQGQALAGAQARVLDRSCARRRRDNAGRGGETGFKSNKETNPQG